MSHCEPDFICSVVNDTKVRVKFVLFFDLSEETMQARILTHERSGLVQNCWEKTQSHLKNLKPRVDHHFPIFSHHEPWPNWPFLVHRPFLDQPICSLRGSSCRAREDQWPCGRQLGAGSPGSRRNQRCAKAPGF